ncbi:MAG: hypothetical protein WD035_01300, partial [Balneolaceae bacterium]
VSASFYPSLEGFAKSLRVQKMSVVLPNLSIFANSKSSFMPNKLRFRIRSGFDIEQNPWFFKALLYIIYHPADSTNSCLDHFLKI